MNTIEITASDNFKNAIIEQIIPISQQLKDKENENVAISNNSKSDSNHGTPPTSDPSDLRNFEETKNGKIPVPVSQSN